MLYSKEIVPIFKRENGYLVATNIEKKSSYSNKREPSKKFIISRKQK
jgi:hypothetical protein